MGCGSSSANERQVQSKAPEQKQTKSRVVYIGEESLKSAFGYLLSKAGKFTSRCGLVPSVCLSKESFSVANHRVKLTPEISIKLPIMTGSFRKLGRVLCFPHIGILDSLHTDKDATRQIVSNGMYWLAGEKTTMTPVLMLGFPDELVMRAKLTLHNLGFFVESCPNMLKLNNFKVVLIPSSASCTREWSENLTRFVEEGGGLGVFFTPVGVNNLLSFPMNDLLHVFGLSYTYCAIGASDANVYMNREYEEVQECHFTHVIEKLKQILSDPNVSPDVLDNIVTTVRYYVLACGEAEKSMMAQLYDICWDFLAKSEAIQGSCFRVNENHGIIFVLLQDVTPKVPPERLRAAIGHELFPGKCENVTCASYTLSLEVVNNAWISTGLYLPPGSVGYIVCDEGLTNVYAQVGAHHESLTPQGSQWKRWPNVVSAFRLDRTRTPVASSFGGIIYLTATDMSDPQLVNIQFENFSMYPRCIEGHDSIWDATKSLGIPWGEIQGSHVVVTLPKENMLRLDCAHVCQVLNQLVYEITEFMAYDVVHPFRIVFDVGLLDDQPRCGYPLIFNTTDIDSILGDLDNPSESLLKLTKMIALLALREDCFDTSVETSLTTVTSLVAFEKVFGVFDPYSLNIPMPPLTEGLWEVYKKNPTVIPDTMRVFQDPTYELTEVPEDTWIEFVRQMCRIGKTNFTPLLERAKPIPLNISLSCGEFKLVDVDQNIGPSPLALG